MTDSACSLLQQGAIIPATALSDKAKAAIMDGRALAEARQRPVLDERKVVVLSQDCDISSDSNIELVVISKEKKGSESIQLNKSYRKLQLQIDGDWWLFEADMISIIKKSLLELNNDGTPIKPSGRLPDKERRILIDWRIGRYKREPLPHNFNLAFLTDYIKKPGNELGTFLSENNDKIAEIYVYVDPNDDDAHEYIVGITALLKDGEDISSAFEQEAAAMLREHCQKLHNDDNVLKMYQIDNTLLPESLPPSDFVVRMENFSFRDASLMRRINLDFLCY